MKDRPHATMLALLVWTSACVDTPGGGDEGESSTHATTTTETGADTSSSSTTTHDASSSDDTTAADTSGGEGPMACGLRCTTALDCCVLSGSFGCEDAIGIYPNDFVCGPEGTCSNHGCATTEDCSMFDSADVHFVCVTRDVFSTCEASCTQEADCFLAGPMYACTGSDARVGSYCEPPQCTGDAECVVPGERCIDGDCERFCTADEHCAGNGSCDLATGECVCTSDTDCNDDWACAPS